MVSFVGVVLIAIALCLSTPAVAPNPDATPRSRSKSPPKKYQPPKLSPERALDDNELKVIFAQLDFALVKLVLNPSCSWIVPKKFRQYLERDERVKKYDQGIKEMLDLVFNPPAVFKKSDNAKGFKKYMWQSALLPTVTIEEIEERIAAQKKAHKNGSPDEDSAKADPGIGFCGTGGFGEVDFNSICGTMRCPKEELLTVANILKPLPRQLGINYGLKVQEHLSKILMQSDQENGEIKIKLNGQWYDVRVASELPQHTASASPPSPQLPKHTPYVIPPPPHVARQASLEAPTGPKGHYV